VKNCLERRLLINCTQGNVIRLLPAMNISEAEVDEGCDRLAAAIQGVAAAAASGEVAAAATADVAEQQHRQQVQ
jgi:hypothetical protein